MLQASRRLGFTLVELLVVLILILALAAITIAFVPRVNERQKTSRAADQIQRWLLIAKQRALRDGVPTGVRLLPGRALPTPNSPNLFWVTDLQYVQQPPDFTVQPGPVHPNTTPLPGTPGVPGGSLSEPAHIRVRRIWAPNTPLAPFPTGVLTSFTQSPTITWLMGLQANPPLGLPTQLLTSTPPLSRHVVVLEPPWGLMLDPNNPGQVIPRNPPPTPQPLSAGDFTGGSGFGATPAPPIRQPFWAVRGAAELGPNPNPPPAALALLTPGDMLQVDNGRMHRILFILNTGGYYVSGGSTNFEGDTLILETPLERAIELDPLPGSTTPRNFNASKTYKIVRVPRVLQGEEPLQLTQDVAIDLITTIPSTQNQMNPPYPASLPPSAGLSGGIDIMFSPSGSVMGIGSGNDKMVLWMRDVTQDDLVPGKVFNGEQVLIVINVRTGSVAAHPVDTTLNATSTGYLDPYTFIRDGRSSGL